MARGLVIAATMRRLIVSGAIAALVTGCTPRVYEVPDGYTGWVIVEHGVVGCPSLPVEQGEVVHRVPASGALCTSDPKEGGWFRRDSYYEVGSRRITIPPDGPPSARRVWSPGDGQNGPYEFDAFFVGTWAQHEADLAGMGEVLSQLRDQDGIGTPVPQGK